VWKAAVDFKSRWIEGEGDAYRRGSVGAFLSPMVDNLCWSSLVYTTCIQLDSTEWRWNVAWTEFSRFFFLSFFLSSSSLERYISPQWRTCPFRAKEWRPLPPPPICCHTGREFKKLLQHSTHVTDVLYTTWRRQQHTHTHTHTTNHFRLIFSGDDSWRPFVFWFSFLSLVICPAVKISVRCTTEKQSSIPALIYSDTELMMALHTCSDVHNSYLYIRVGYI
jgi:hypothetical protein